MSPALSYQDLLQSLNLESLKVRRNDHCQKLINQVVSEPEHKLHHFLPAKNNCPYDLRKRGFVAFSSIFFLQ